MDEIVTDQIREEEFDAFVQAVDADIEWQEARRYELKAKSCGH